MKQPRLIEVRIDELTIQHLIEKTYVNGDNYDLKSLAEGRKKGHKRPISITTEKVVFDGAKRLKADSENGETHIWAFMYEAQEADIPEYILRANEYRQKTEQEMMAETYLVYTEVIPSLQGQKFGDEPVKTRIERAIEMTQADTSPRRFQQYVAVRQLDERNPELKLIERFNQGKVSINKAEMDGKKAEKRKNDKEESKEKPLLPPVKKVLYELHNGSSELMKALANNSIPLAVTSPPYPLQRTYNKADKNELGHEKTAEEYVANLMKIMKEVYRVLKPGGSFFVNIGNKFNKGKHFNHCEMLVLEMAKLGFYKINTIIWQKTGGLLRGEEETVFNSSYEYIYWFVKDADKHQYYFEPVKDFSKDQPIRYYETGGRRNPDGTKTPKKMVLSKGYEVFSDFIDEQHFFDVITGKPASYETAKIKQLYGEHPAMYSSCIPLLPILHCSKPGDIVLDPFLGSGSTAVAALLTGRKAVGYEKFPDYFEIAKKRLEDVVKDIDPEMAKTIELQYDEKRKAS